MSTYKTKYFKKTKKITRAMEMISASKLFKCKKRMEMSKPYAKLAKAIIEHLSKSNPEYKHPYLIERKVKRVGFIVISSDRGLCGGLNLNVFKIVLFLEILRSSSNHKRIPRYAKITR